MKDSGILPEAQKLASRLAVVLTQAGRLPLEWRNLEQSDKLYAEVGCIEDEIAQYGYTVEGDWYPPLDGRENWTSTVILKNIDPETATPEEIKEYNWWFAGRNGLPELGEFPQAA